MSDLEKIDIVLNQIQTVYGLTENTKNLLKTNIIKRAEMYKDIKPNINADESSIIINPNSNIDVFLNRLVNNIRDYKISNNYITPSQLRNKGDYAGLKQTLTMESYNSIKESIKDKFNSKGVSITNEQLDVCVRKVFNHEIGHVLQYSFKGNDGLINDNYNKLVANLSQMYPNTFKIPVKQDLNKINGGVKAKDNSIYSKQLEGTKLLDEIFNESEALEVSNMNEVQFEYNMGFGNKIITNYDSSNYKITSYGVMMKIIMGQEKTYRAMYEDSNIVYTFFDQFKDVAKEVFKTNDTTTPMRAILIGLDKVRNESNINVANDLDLFFTKCLEKRVYHDLRNPNITDKEIERISNYINAFHNQMIKSPNGSLEQEMIINNLKELTNKKSIEISEQKEKDNSVIETTEIRNENNNSIETQTNDREVINQNKEQLNDFNYCISQMEKIVNSRRTGTNLSEEDKRKMVNNIYYYEGYLIKSIKSTQDFETAVKLVVSKFNNDSFEKQIQLNVLQDLQDHYKKNININNNTKGKTPIEQELEKIRYQVNGIKQEYRNMFFTEYTDEQQDNLMTRLSVINNDLISLRHLVKNEKELQILNDLTQLINKELNKMSDIKNKVEASVKTLGR